MWNYNPPFDTHFLILAAMMDLRQEQLNGYFYLNEVIWIHFPLLVPFAFCVTTLKDVDISCQTLKP